MATEILEQSFLYLSDTSEFDSTSIDSLVEWKHVHFSSLLFVLWDEFAIIEFQPEQELHLHKTLRSPYLLLPDTEYVPFALKNGYI